MMKNCINILIVSALILVSTLSVNAQSDNTLARVQKNNGLYVFVDNEPVMEYEIVDRVKSSISWSGQFSEIRNKLIRKAVSDFPNADGIVITMSSSSADRAIVIKFKEGQNKDDFGLAKVNKANGLLVFSDCEPVSEYEIIEREKVSFSWSGAYQAVRDKLIKKALKDTPDAEGVVCTFSNASSDKAVVIKFKK